LIRHTPHRVARAQGRELVDVARLGEFHEIEQPRALATQRKAVPPHVEAAVMQGLEKLAADRFATAAEFAEALQGRGDPSSGGRYITASAAAPSTRRGWMERAAWITMVAAVGVFGWTRAQAPAPSEAPIFTVSRLAFVISEKNQKKSCKCPDGRLNSFGNY
jgi:hypothetical protein